MGNKESKPSVIPYEEALKRVSEDELKRLREAFKRYSIPAGYMSKLIFVKDVMGDAMPQKLGEHLFFSFGGTNKGITFKDLFCGLVMLTRGRQAEKLRYGDYIGCYAHGCLNFDYNISTSESVTPDSCTASCKHLGFPVASLSQGKKCSCSCQQTCLAKPLGDMYCATPCQDLTRFCGGYVAASVYRVREMNTINITCYEVYEEYSYSETPLDAPDDGRRMLSSILISIFVTIFFCAVVVTTVILVHRWLHKTQNTESTTVEEVNAEERPSIETKNTPVSRQDERYSRKSQIVTPLRNSQHSTKPSIKPRVSTSSALKDITRKSHESSAALKDIRRKTRDNSAAEDFYAEAHYDGTSIASSIKRAREDTSDDYRTNPDLLDHNYIYPVENPSHFQRKFMNSRITKDGYLMPEVPLPRPPSIMPKKYSSARLSRLNNKDMALSSGSHDRDDRIYYEI